MAKDSGTVNIHGKEYKTVAARVQEFREKHKDAYSIVTEIVSSDEQRVVMKASILHGTIDTDSKTQPVVATGHAEEVRTSSQINRTSALENAETSAIGRALAAFGLAGTEYASADEVAQAITQQRTPQTSSQSIKQVFPEAEASYAAKNAPKLGTEVTPKQLGFIKQNFGILNIDDREDMLKYVIKLIGREVSSSTELTKAEAKKVIDKQLSEIEGEG